MDSELPLVEKLPWYVRFAADRQRRGKRGGNFLLRNMRRLGMLDKCIALPLNDRESVIVPVYWMYVWLWDSLETYERDAVTRFSAAVLEMGSPAVFVDCGADVGIFSRAVLARAGNITGVVAFEPNERSCALLRRNLSAVRVPVDVRCAGVFDAPGHGQLNAEPYKSHGGFIESVNEGGIRLHTIDELEVPPAAGLAIKIDVEGGELRVLRGAAKSLKAAREIVVQFEAHPEVAARTGVDPIECLRFIASLRDCRWFVAESPDARIVLEKPFFDQMPRDSNCNVIVVSAH